VSVLLLDTNVVSILFNRNHTLRPYCIKAVAGRQLAIAFMTRAELLLWPTANNWGEQRRSTLVQHLALYTTLYPDERTCDIWVKVVDRCRRAGKPIQTADAWIASTARQWELPLVTADFGDYEAIDDLEVVPISSDAAAAPD
jgi:predicted nucleic acid-binding protein